MDHVPSNPFALRFPKEGFLCSLYGIRIIPSESLSLYSFSSIHISNQFRSIKAFVISVFLVVPQQRYMASVIQMEGEELLNAVSDLCIQEQVEICSEAISLLSSFVT